MAAMRPGEEQPRGGLASEEAARLAVALLAVPAVLAADALHKRWRRWQRVNHQAGQGSPCLL